MLRGGIVGCGFFGQIQLEAWGRIAGAQIVAACDLELERARQSAPRAYNSLEEMLAREQLDFVDIATRPASHLPLVRLAALHRVAVICQKPMAPGWEEAVALVEAAEAAGIRLMIHENWRWQPWYREARRLAAEGAIGQPIGYLFRTRRRDGLGPAPYSHQPYFSGMPRLIVYETMVHQIDTARFLFGEIAQVYAQIRRINPVIAGEDQALIILTHRDGVMGTLDGHRFLDPVPDGPAMGDAWLEGDAGSLYIQATGDIYAGDRKLWSNHVREGYRGDCVRATQQHFIECLESGAPFESGGRDYLQTFGAVEAAYRSAAERRAIPVHPF
jgi:predicted dehydrogenase